MNCQEYQDDLKRRAANDEAAQETQKMLEVRDTAIYVRTLHSDNGWILGWSFTCTETVGSQAPGHYLLLFLKKTVFVVFLINRAPIYAPGN